MIKITPDFLENLGSWGFQSPLVHTKKNEKWEIRKTKYNKKTSITWYKTCTTPAEWHNHAPDSTSYISNFLSFSYDLQTKLKLAIYCKLHMLSIRMHFSKGTYQTNLIKMHMLYNGFGQKSHSDPQKSYLKL